MCGIAAIFLFPEERPPEMWQAIKDNFKHNLLANEERGREATGVAVVQKDGWIDLEKKPVQSTDFVETEAFESLMSLVRAETTLILGHTRRPTKGSVALDSNNHPLQAGSVFGVHNGIIQNDDELFTGCNCQRQGEVDSEILFRLIEQVELSNDDNDYVQNVQEQLIKMQGKFTFISADLRNPSQLLVMKHQNPLSVHYHAEWKALVFSSRYAFLRKTFGTDVITEIIPKEKLLLFDAEKIPLFGIKPVAAQDFSSMV